MSTSGCARAAEHTQRWLSTAPGPTTSADVERQLAATSPRNLLAAGRSTSPVPLAKPASARLSGEGSPAGTAPKQGLALSAENNAAEPLRRGNESGSLWATAPMRSLASGAGPGKVQGVNLGSPPWQPKRPVPAQPQAAVARQWLLCTRCFAQCSFIIQNLTGLFLG